MEIEQLSRSQLTKFNKAVRAIIDEEMKGLTDHPNSLNSSKRGFEPCTVLSQYYKSYFNDRLYSFADTNNYFEFDDTFHDRLKKTVMRITEVCNEYNLDVCISLGRKYFGDMSRIQYSSYHECISIYSTSEKNGVILDSCLKI